MKRLSVIAILLVWCPLVAIAQTTPQHGATGLRVFDGTGKALGPFFLRVICNSVCFDGFALAAPGGSILMPVTPAALGVPILDAIRLFHGSADCSDARFTDPSTQQSPF